MLNLSNIKLQLICGLLVHLILKVTGKDIINAKAY